MSRALTLAWRGLYTTHPNPRVGCVMTRDGRIVGEGWHRAAGAAHAEINALEAAGEAARGATCYVTLEPCGHHGRTPPCSRALIEAGAARVIYAMNDPNPAVAGGGLAALREAGIETHGGLMSTQAEALNAGYAQRMRTGRPYVRCKLGMSLDARTAAADGASRWITGPEARRDVQFLRARSGAILTGSGTVLQDDPRLTVREAGLDDRQPLRVVADRRLRFPASAQMLRLPGRTIIFTCADDAESRRKLEDAGAEVVVVQGPGTGFTGTVLAHLAGKEEINDVLVESGPQFAGALLADGLVDELVIYMAPVLLGDAARGLFHLPALRALNDRIALDMVDIRAVGGDWRITARPVRNGGKP